MARAPTGGSKPYYQIVREVLSANVAAGNLPVGTRLLTTAVADRLGVSRPPVKRALELLEADGVITALSSQGYVVGDAAAGTSPERTNLHRLELDLPLELGDNLGQASWERIFEAVEAEILNCIPFGTFQISESLIGEHFDVSRTVVRDVLSRLDARGLIVKDRSSHWIAGPLSARMLDDAHEIRRLIEPGALASAMPMLSAGFLRDSRAAVTEALERSTALSVGEVDAMEQALHVEALEPLRNRRLAGAVRLQQVSLVINRLFATYIGLHDESDMLREHALILDHMLLGDAEGATVAMRHHLDADHARSRARLKVLSVFDAAEIAPYLVRIH
ncbi:DNA-binding transcriptional regulator, GntR family [Kaistia soli DSM 19436]|uniref:DNA-binding transcriptional regulator, GntR family n=1 Tax=Kaistia soli DSM 19436 TaxID=1122133 RepID=A0A1M5G9X8_9HYPH|nr:GntR family transcriptional regulator [Kaistia soli]SHG00494.1 DNA-binding transcriptional regulator, GntR family [Kaistia soli DSM 19436]